MNNNDGTGKQISRGQEMDEMVVSSTIKLDGGSDSLKHLLRAMQ